MERILFGLNLQCFFYWRIFFTKFQPEIYDVKIYEEIFMGKNGPNSSNFELPESYDDFQKVAKNIEGFWFFFSFPTFISSMQPNLAKLFFG
jgi:hypothetical protein